MRYVQESKLWGLEVTGEHVNCMPLVVSTANIKSRPISRTAIQQGVWP